MYTVAKLEVGQPVKKVNIDTGAVEDTLAYGGFAVVDSENRVAWWRTSGAYVTVKYAMGIKSRKGAQETADYLNSFNL